MADCKARADNLLAKVHTHELMYATELKITASVPSLFTSAQYNKDM